MTDYQNENKRLVEIFRSLGEEGLYLYVDKKKGMARVPTALLERLGKVESAMMLMLEPSRKLARADAARVLEAISEQGFYLQLPPLPDDEMRAMGLQNQKLERRP